MQPEHITLQNEYFAEYRQMIQTRTDAMTDLKLWEKVELNNPPETNILYFPLEKQALYADYVSKKMTENHKNLVNAIATDYFNAVVDRYDGSCAVANVAIIILSMEESPLKQQVLEKHLELIEKTKNASPSSCALC